MAKRPIFIPTYTGGQHVKEALIEFEWIPGLAKSQKQKCVLSLHESAKRHLGLTRILEISSKSLEEGGVALSAFNLLTKISNYERRVPVEVVYQASKEFEAGGPFWDLLGKNSRDAKADERLRSSGKVTAFVYGNERWPLEPASAFYDWLYINALMLNRDLADTILKYEAFTDIEFNPSRSIGCQARSAAIYASLRARNEIEMAMESKSTFLAILNSSTSWMSQRDLFSKTHL